MAPRHVIRAGVAKIHAEITGAGVAAGTLAAQTNSAELAEAAELRAVSVELAKLGHRLAPFVARVEAPARKLRPEFCRKARKRGGAR